MLSQDNCLPLLLKCQIEAEAFMENKRQVKAKIFILKTRDMDLCGNVPSCLYFSNNKCPLWIKPSDSFFLGQHGEDEAWSLHMKTCRVVSHLLSFSSGFSQTVQVTNTKWFLRCVQILQRDVGGQEEEKATANAFLICLYIALFLQRKNDNNMKLTEVNGKPSRHFSGLWLMP